MGGIGRAQNGSHIAWFLNTLHDNNQGGFAQVKLVKGVLPGDDLGNDTLGAATIGHLIIYIGRNLEESGSINHGLFIAINLWTPKESIYLITGLNAALYLSPTLYDK